MDQLIIIKSLDLLELRPETETILRFGSDNNSQENDIINYKHHKIYDPIVRHHKL